MGTCYSTHSRPINISTVEMPHDSSSLSTEPRPDRDTTVPAPGSQFGFRKPYGGRYGKASNSNEQSSRVGAEVKRSPLGTVAEPQSARSVPNSAKSSAETLESAPRRFGFGFKGPSTKRIGDSSSKQSAVNASEESLNSNSAVSSSKRDSVRSVNPKRLGAFDPKDKHASLESWRMIDDSSTAESVSSGGDKASRRAENNKETINEEDVKNGNRSPQRTPVSIKSSSSDSTITDRKSTNGAVKPTGGSKLQSRLRGPLAKFYASRSVDKAEKTDNWVRASSAAPTSEVKPGKAAQPAPKKTGGVQGFLRRGLLRKQKSESSANSPAKKSSSASHSKDKGDKKVRDQGVNTANGEAAPVLKEASEDAIIPESVSAVANIPHKLSGAQRMFDIPPGKAPIAMIDSIETTSIGSINSDDLMLETDIPLDDYEELGPSVSEANGRHPSGSDKVPRTRRNSNPRSRSRSHSRDSLDGDTAARKGMQRSVSDTRGALGGKTDTTQKKSSKSVSLDIPDENEPLQELASLLDKNNAVTRRNPRLHRASRPASFPGWRTAMEGEGPVSGGGSTGGTPTGSSTTPTEGGKVLKPPRQPSIDDSEPVTLDAFTYRQMMQDITQFKTLLLKLKRNIQEEEIGTPIGQPFNQSWGSKNGFKQMGSSSQPGSPFCPEEQKRFSFGEKDPAPGVSLDEVMQENSDLRQQLQMLQHQVEEQERTIRLLQQQMTKYECGHVGPGGKCFTHTGSQTDKPRLPISKSVFETGSSRRVESSEGQPVVRYRTELSSSVRTEMENEDEEEEEIEDYEFNEDVELHIEEESGPHVSHIIKNVLDNDVDDRQDEHGRIDAIEGADDCDDNTDKDIDAFTDDDTHVLSSGTEPLRDEAIMESGGQQWNTDTVTSVTEELVSSLSSPSSDLGGFSSDLQEGSPMKVSEENGLLSESELQSLSEEFSMVGKIQSTPMVPRMPANVTFVADVATPDSDAGSIHDFNVQTEEKLENYQARSLVQELEEVEQEGLAKTQPNPALNLAAELEIANGQNGHGDLNSTFIVNDSSVINVKLSSVSSTNSKQTLNTTFTMSSSQSAPSGEPGQNQGMVRSETHSSGYQSDVMAASTTSSDAMATSATSGDIMVSSAGSNDGDNNNVPGYGKKDGNLNGVNSNGNEAKSRLTKPKLTGLQKPKFSRPQNGANTTKDKIVEESKAKGSLKDTSKRQLIAPSAGRAKQGNSQIKQLPQPKANTVSTTTGSKGTAANPTDSKSKLPSALPKPGKIPSYGGGGSAAKPGSKLPAYGSKVKPGAGGRSSLLKAPAKSGPNY